MIMSPEGERISRGTGGPSRTPLRAIKADPEDLRKAFAALR
jgi:hypothetical protein